MCDIRGNVDTRLAEARQRRVRRLVLALAGLKRLGLDSRVTEWFEPTTMLPAAGQGAWELKLELTMIRRSKCLRHSITCRRTSPCVAERSLLARFMPAARRRWEPGPADAGGQLSLQAVVLSLDGRERLAATGTANAQEAELPAGSGGTRCQGGRDSIQLARQS